MHRVPNGIESDEAPARRAPRRRLLVAVAASAAVLTVASACTSAKSDQATPPGTGPGSSTSGPSTSGTSPSSPTPQPVLQAKLSTIPKPGSHNVNPASPFTVNVEHGTLKSVRMLNPEGKKVRGTMSADGTSWHTTEALGYAKTYRVKSVAVESDGTRVVRKTKIHTVSPGNQTEPYLERIGNYALGHNETFGVGIVPIVHFDEAISNKKAAEKAMQVVTSPHVDGAWYWSDDQDAHWRPEHYWTPGTKVTIKADVYGVKLGQGLYGSTDKQASFTIGRKQIVVADDNAPNAVNKVKVWRNGKLVRTMNTSMGEHGGTYANGQYINFYTLDGAYTVIAHENPANMCSASYGLPADAPGGYGCEPIYWSTKISIDGIYLHELDSTVWDQDNGYDVSHGCLNLNYDNAHWYFNHSMIGDPVIVNGAKGAPEIQVWEGGDWSVPWKKWVKGGAA